MNTKPRVFSGIQATGNVHIGNYLGAIKNWVNDQDEKENFFCVVDLHAITIPKDPKVLRENIQEAAKILLACGIDPKKSVLFVQSNRHEHSELSWILNCFTNFGELSRMTQFKDKKKGIEGKINNQIIDVILKTLNKHGSRITPKEKIEIANTVFEETTELRDKLINQNVSVGLFDYPVLMAADILLYDTDLVPVGADQKQHVELTRNIAERLNNKFGDVFTVPKPDIRDTGARIMALDNPKTKMAKSADTIYNYIALRDDPEVIRKKIQKAVTDSGSEIVYNPEKKPALANLLTIYSGFSDEPISEIVAKYQGKGYADFKKDLADVIIYGLRPIQDRLRELDEDPKYIAEILSAGSQKAAPIAAATLARVKNKIGLG